MADFSAKLSDEPSQPFTWKADQFAKVFRQVLIGGCRTARFEIGRNGMDPYKMNFYSAAFSASAAGAAASAGASSLDAAAASPWGSASDEVQRVFKRLVDFSCQRVRTYKIITE